MGLGMLAFLFNLYRSLKHGELAGKDPWGGTTLEWWTESPPPPKNFETLAEIRSREPVLDWSESP